jgi:hypothetical protein
LKNFVKVFSPMTIMDQFIRMVQKTMKLKNTEAQDIHPLQITRRRCRKIQGHLSWVHGHLEITQRYSFDRVPLPDKGERAGRRGRKATGQGWALIAGLPKETSFKRQRKCQDFRAY